MHTQRKVKRIKNNLYVRDGYGNQFLNRFLRALESLNRFLGMCTVGEGGAQGDCNWEPTALLEPAHLNTAQDFIYRFEAHTNTHTHTCTHSRVRRVCARTWPSSPADASTVAFGQMMQSQDKIITIAIDLFIPILFIYSLSLSLSGNGITTRGTYKQFPK